MSLARSEAPLISNFSFYYAHHMSTIEGGMICTNRPEILDNIRAYRWVGMDKDNWKKAEEYVGIDQDAMHWFYEISVLGYKYNMNDLAAAIGLAQLEKLPSMNQRRMNSMGLLVDGVNSINGIDEAKDMIDVDIAVDVVVD